MASIMKYTNRNHDIDRILAHHERSLKNNSNKDIDPERFCENKRLHPQRNMSDKAYYYSLIDECYVYGRADVKTLGEIIVTAPQELDKSREDEFFSAAYAALNDFCAGEKYCVSARVHGDESGAAHLHYDFVPAVPDKNPKHPQNHKVCMTEVLSRKKYYELHSYLQAKAGDPFGINLHTGVTEAQGGNRTVRELKAARDRARTMPRGRIR